MKNYFYSVERFSTFTNKSTLDSKFYSRKSAQNYLRRILSGVTKFGETIESYGSDCLVVSYIAPNSKKVLVTYRIICL